MLERIFKPGLRWTLAAIARAIVLYVAAISSDFYQLTSPESLTWHVALRKAYSIVAFGVLGYVTRRALVERRCAGVARLTIALLALVSGAIEAGQFLYGSTEGLAWNAFDILCGAIGGALGVADLIRSEARTRRDLG